jgi:hypothetical protein
MTPARMLRRADWTSLVGLMFVIVAVGALVNDALTPPPQPIYRLEVGYGMEVPADTDLSRTLGKRTTRDTATATTEADQ